MVAVSIVICEYWIDFGVYRDIIFKVFITRIGKVGRIIGKRRIAY